MAKILDFKLRAAQGVKRKDGDAGEIVIFPGIRYERLGNEATVPRGVEGEKRGEAEMAAVLRG